MISDLLLVAIGNTRTRIARAKVDGAIEPSAVFENADLGTLVEAAVTAAQALPEESSRVLVASVNEEVAARLVHALQAPDLPRMVRLVTPGAPGGVQGLSIPMQADMPAPLSVGADRLLASLGAYDRSKTACVVIDAGTAITVNFVDEFGVFHGGVIAPGLGLMLRALSEHTSALPRVDPPRKGVPGGGHAVPSGPMGKTTAEAMTLGCVHALVGLCHRMIDLCAQQHGRYPRVVATGGDAPLLFEHDELVEAIVPDLVLVGMQSAWRIAEGGGEPGRAEGGVHGALEDDEDL